MKLNIVLGDCLEILKTFPDKSFDLCLTDPPYGIGADKGVGGFGSSETDNHYDDDWDTAPSQEVFDEIIRVSKKVIIFGGQFFRLPLNGHWIVWDKKGNIEFDNPFGDCELAWTNIERNSVKKYTVIQQGFVSEERTRFHPTQKPVSLFEQILHDYADSTSKILDPYMGSGTTLIAAHGLGIDATGIEISPKYCEITQDRLDCLSNPLF